MTEITLNSVIDLNTSASLLEISPLTVRNWIKHDYIKPIKERPLMFNLVDIEKLKQSIKNGEIKRLHKRANKKGSEISFIPKEYLADKDDFYHLERVISYVRDNKISPDLSLLFLAVNLLNKMGILQNVSNDLISLQNLQSSNEQIIVELNDWIKATNCHEVSDTQRFLLTVDLPSHTDILGLIYQSLLLEGSKAQSGSYYTPTNLVKEIANDHAFTEAKVLDPCCGTGQFLLAFADSIKNPSNLFGLDIDQTAVRIARINLLIQFKDIKFVPNIQCKNTLIDLGGFSLFDEQDDSLKDFDIVATNPPWGVHFNDEDRGVLSEKYPEITSFESFSYFLKTSFDLLKENGVLSFILPESILGVGTHRDIRKFILENTSIEKVVYLERIFQNVFSPVIRLDLRKKKDVQHRFTVIKKDTSHEISQDRILNNQDFIFDIHTNENDSAIINKVFESSHTTLQNNAEWALGIVTGNNEKYISEEPCEGFEEVYKGKDVEQFSLRPASCYLRFIPDDFQQIAPVQKYRAQEKLIYKFISKNLVFAFDDKQKLTLNSANILIPKLKDYPNKVIAALFNSSLYQFIFQKKFATIKVLRGHLEQLPIPLWDREVLCTIEDWVDKIISSESAFNELDQFIMNQYKLTPSEIQHVTDSLV